MLRSFFIICLAGLIVAQCWVIWRYYQIHQGWVALNACMVEPLDERIVCLDTLKKDEK